MCLEDFLLKALGNDIDSYLSADGATIVEKLDESIFKSASGYFLGALVWRVLERDAETLPHDNEALLRDVSQKLADRIVYEFEQKFKNVEQVTHRQIFRVFQENPDWLIGELRR